MTEASGSILLTEPGTYEFSDGRPAVTVPYGGRKTAAIPGVSEYHLVTRAPGQFFVALDREAPAQREPGKVYRRWTYNGQTVARDAGLVKFDDKDCDFFGIGDPDAPAPVVTEGEQG